MTKPGTQASRCIFCKIASVVAPLAAGVVASPGPSCRRRPVGALLTAATESHPVEDGKKNVFAQMP
jgi:hypothetical protein